MKNNGEQLIHDLLLNPASFFDRGQSFHLLQEYFKGMTLETLIPLLQSQDRIVQRTAIWIVSELASQACSLISFVVPLVKSEDLYVKCYALECIILCSVGDNSREIIHIINGINDSDQFIRIRAMHLLSNADESQLKTGAEMVEILKTTDYKVHQDGLGNLSRAFQLSDQEVMKILYDDYHLTQKYGVMIARKNYERRPNLLKHALTSINSDVKEFARQELDQFV